MDIVFLRYAVSAIMVYFSKYLTYSTSNVQLSEEPIEWPNYADKKSAQLKAINSKYTIIFLLLFDEYNIWYINKLNSFSSLE